MKELCINVIGLDREYVYGTDEQKNTFTDVQWDNMPLSIRFKYRNSWYSWLRSGPMSIREVLQVVGTDIFRRMFDDQIWVKALFRKSRGDVDYVIVPDVRFPNELKAVEAQGEVLRIVRDTDFEDNHASETALDDYSFEHYYVNNNSLQVLESFLEQWMNNTILPSREMKQGS